MSRRASCAKSAARAGGTAGSSTNGIGRGRPGAGTGPGSEGARQARPPDRPDAGLGGRIQDHAGAVDASERTRDEIRGPAVLDDQRGRRVGHVAEERRHRGRTVRGIEGRRVHELDRARAVLEKADDRSKRLVHRSERDEGQPPTLGQGHEPDLGAEDHGERAFGADDQPRPVRVLAAEGVQVVAGDAPEQARSAEAPGERRRGGERGGWTPATTERRDRPVGQRDVERLDGVRRQPVDDRPRTGRVVPDHAAERGATGRRDVGPEGEAVRGRGAIEVVEHHPGPDAGETRVRVDVDPGEVRRWTTRPLPTACPARLVPAPRIVSGTPSAAHAASAATRSSGPSARSAPTGRRR